MPKPNVLYEDQRQERLFSEPAEDTPDVQFDHEDQN